jgi:D-alanyl-D-alanine carboxypeptidase (penicillin-binding protein 5/6)
MDADTGLVLYGTQAHTQLQPASVTKVMTALVVMEQVYNLDARIVFSHDAVFSIPRSSSHIYMDVDETLSVYEALMALMLPSANEVANALAEYVAGSVYEFAHLMNMRAAALGAVNTHFVNPSGLPAHGHVTTAYDMALIMREAVNHPTFVEIIGTAYSRIPPTERQADYRPLRNTNLMIHPGRYFNENVIGGKTGWTNAAGHTLVTYAANDERRLIISVLKGVGRGTFTDTAALMDYGFAVQFESVQLFDSTDYVVSIPVFQEINGYNTRVGTVGLRAESSIYVDLPQDHDPTWVRHVLDVPESLTPPVSMGQAVGGGLAVYVQGMRAGHVRLIAQDTILSYRPIAAAYSGYGGGGDYLYSLYTAAADGYAPFPFLPDFMNSELVLTFIIPITVSFFTLLLAAIGLVASRRRRRRKMDDYVVNIRPDYIYRGW